MWVWSASVLSPVKALYRIHLFMIWYLLINSELNSEGHAWSQHLPSLIDLFLLFLLVLLFQSFSLEKYPFMRSRHLSAG